MKIYSLKNELTNYFNRPMFFESDEEAISTIQNNIASDHTKALFNLAENMSLYYCGDIDFVTFKVIQPKKPIFIKNVLSICDGIKFKEVIYKDECEKLS